MTKNITKILQKASASLLVLFVLVAKCNAQLIGPSIYAQPIGTSVQNGGTAVFTVAADAGLLDLSGISFKWYCTSNKVTRLIGANPIITILNEVTNSLLGTILGGNKAVSILTIKNVNYTNVGSYYVEATDTLGMTASVKVTLSIIPVINIASSASTLTTAGFNVQMSTPVGSNVVVEASSDMVNWTPIYTNLNSSGTLTYTDTDATNHTSRYYRARTQ